MNKDLIIVLMFLLVLVILFWYMPNQKIDIIGDFFKKVITPLAIPISLIIATFLGIIKYKKVMKNNNND